MSADQQSLSHTPGPWLAEADYEHGPIVTASDGSIVADYTCWDGHRKEAVANARLIASAPALLEACRAAAFELTEAKGIRGQVRDRCIAAISKALGETQ